MNFMASIEQEHFRPSDILNNRDDVDRILSGQSWQPTVRSGESSPPVSSSHSGFMLPNLELQNVAPQVSDSSQSRAADTVMVAQATQRDSGQAVYDVPAGAYENSALFGALNRALSGQRPEQYRPITNRSGSPVVVSRPQDRTTTIPFVIDGKTTPVAIDLPGFRGDSVSFATDGRHIVAIDSRNNDAWMLQRNTLFGATTGYEWSRINRR